MEKSDIFVWANTPLAVDPSNKPLRYYDAKSNVMVEVLTNKWKCRLAIIGEERLQLISVEKPKHDDNTNRQEVPSSSHTTQ